MCAPAALLAASLIVTTATTALQYQGEQKQAKSQYNFAKKAAEEGQALARQEFELNNRQETLRQQQEDESAGQELQQVRAEASRARSTARVAAGESGISGLSVDALLADFDRQEAVSTNAINRNREFGNQQSIVARQGIRTRGMQQLSQTRFKPIARPSLVNAGLSLAGQGVNAYGKYRTD